MKRSIYLLPVFISLAFVLAPSRAFAQCGVERWSVKTGTDPDAGLVNLAAASPTTVNTLLALPRPTLIPDNQRLVPTETTLWTMTATLNGYFVANDSDYHMVLTNGAGKTMIAEIPAPICVGPGSPFATGIAHARAQMDARFTAPPPGIFQTVNIPVQLTGVGFFDFIEGQTGQAPNGVELHPVIDLIFSPSFALTASPSALSITQSGAGSSTISLSGNLNATVALAVSGLPAGATASFSPSSITSPGPSSATMTISVGATTAAGTYPIVVSGTGGGQTHTVTINLTVTAANTTMQLLGNSGFENGSANPAPWTVTPQVIDNSTFEAPHTGAWKAWLDGYGSAHTDSIFQTVAIPATASSATLSFWLHIDTAETTTTTAFDTLKVQVRNSSGVVLSTLATYSNLNHNLGYTPVSFDLTAYAGQTIQIFLIGVENQGGKTSFVVDDFALSAAISATASDFAISSSPSSVTVTQGSSIPTTISTTVSVGFSSPISLSASGLPAGATAVFSPSSIAAPGAGSSTLTISTSSTTPTGTYSITVTGSGGLQTHATTVTLVVNAATPKTLQLLGNAGFESGSANPSPWTVTPAVIDSNTAAEPPHSGAWKAWLDGYGSPHTDSIMQQVLIPATATNATLTFWLHIDTAETSTTTAFDIFKVQVRNSSGIVLSTLATYSNLNAAAGYVQVSFDLTSFKGQTIQIYLVGVEDQGLKTSFVVDDFALNVTTP